ncbi:hypothetical protein GCM10010199_70740 [Dactylosporangium roseum]
MGVTRPTIPQRNGAAVPSPALLQTVGSAAAGGDVQPVREVDILNETTIGEADQPVAPPG